MAHKIKSNFVVVARNVSTGQIVELPVSTRDEVKRMKWYPQNDYVPLKVMEGSKASLHIRNPQRISSKKGGE